MQRENGAPCLLVDVVDAFAPTLLGLQWIVSSVHSWARCGATQSLCCADFKREHRDTQTVASASPTMTTATAAAASASASASASELEASDQREKENDVFSNTIFCKHDALVGSESRGAPLSVADQSGSKNATKYKHACLGPFESLCARDWTAKWVLSPGGTFKNAVLVLRYAKAMQFDSAEPAACAGSSSGASGSAGSLETEIRVEFYHDTVHNNVEVVVELHFSEPGGVSRGAPIADVMLGKDRHGLCALNEALSFALLLCRGGVPSRFQSDSCLRRVNALSETSGEPGAELCSNNADECSRENEQLLWNMVQDRVDLYCTVSPTPVGVLRVCEAVTNWERSFF